jgi:hypothetical protein
MIKSDGVAEIKECSLVARQPRKRCDGFGPDRGHVSPLLQAICITKVKTRDLSNGIFFNRLL